MRFPSYGVHARLKAATTTTIMGKGEADGEVFVSEEAIHKTISILSSDPHKNIRQVDDEIDDTTGRCMSSTMSAHHGQVRIPIEVKTSRPRPAGKRRSR